MPFVRRMLALTLATAALTTAAVVANPPAFAQDPPGQGAGKDKGKNKDNGKAGANQKKPARRKPKGNGAVGAIVPYPLGGALIIRHTPETHDEIQAFLNMLRYE